MLTIIRLSKRLQKEGDKRKGSRKTRVNSVDHLKLFNPNSRASRPWRPYLKYQILNNTLTAFSLSLSFSSSSGGHATFFSFLNSFIHVIMYTYYGLAAIGPHMNKYLGWKRYLTALQMVQFVLIFTHSFQLLFRECNFPSAFMAWIGGHGILFLFLFSDFYKQTYTKKSDKMLTNSCKQNETIESLKRALSKRLDWFLLNIIHFFTSWDLFLFAFSRERLACLIAYSSTLKNSNFVKERVNEKEEVKSHSLKEKWITVCGATRWP